MKQSYSPLPPYLWVLLALPACATFEQSQLAGAVNAGGGAGEIADSGSPLGGVGGTGSLGISAGEQHAGGAHNGGESNGGAGVILAGAAGTATGIAGAGGSSFTAGAGGAPAAGAGSGGASSGGGVLAAGASAGGASAINPCERKNWSATASESSLVAPNDNPAADAIDGVPGTRWSTGIPPIGGEWFLVDLGAKAARLSKVVLDTTASTGDIPPAYKLELSVDNAKYTQVAAGPGADVTTIPFAETSARYIKVTQTHSSTATQGHWWSIHELTLACSP